MSKELGIGVPVFISWAPDDRIQSTKDPRLSKGVILAGPIPPGGVGVDHYGRNVSNNTRLPFWDVGAGDMCYYIPEDLLTPIDDDDDASEREAEKPREVEYV